ncbi:oxidoreductase [Rhodonellum psychrophilum GCM71 = DSM 17998]|uniref:Oxidoreductase n=2 Tax=Rhodonellum TaxID=336827 RepID=U5C3I9_9BACT|nr:MULTISPECIES: SDR family oxidoreductase [Rhodonellum]ERM84354.1 oxidoreductase [Rhodonellum psychrophilum GCM71 = DSM 17998]MDO9551837.1 SDR family oxidoreductase [Rhodonellum sp.]SDZ42783.1 NAD(P)-dependent dehydrogenase, short-chain alcohol dehydrogenase family [Rhodonellum ikkaensis]
MKDKNVVIIGGNSGIGLKVSEMLEAKGANVFLFSKTASGESKLDVTEDFETISGLPTVIDGFVYCPGTINLKPFHRFSLSDFRNDYEINVLGAVKTLKACMPGLKKSSSGSVVLFSTVAVKVGLGFHSSISSAKGAVEGLAKSLAAEWAPNGIRVNVVSPSLTDTPLAATLLGNEDKKEASNKRHPLGRYGQPADIASATVYLLSDEASWMTGQNLHVDGGMSSIK